MSRSHRKTPIVPMTTAASDKAYKVSEHRAERRNLRARLTSSLDADDRRLHATAYGDPWRSNKDGKQIVRATPRNLRK